MDKSQRVERENVNSLEVNTLCKRLVLAGAEVSVRRAREVVQGLESFGV